jgi:hypothetical protein
LSRTGTRPLIVAGALIAAGGMYWLSRIPVNGSYLADLLPGMLVLSFGVGPMFVAVTTAANAGVPADKAGLAASLLNASQQVGGALGLAILTAVATSRTNDLLAARVDRARADRRLPAGAVHRQCPDRGFRRDRTSRHQHPRRACGGRRAAARESSSVMTARAVWPT